MKNIKKISLAIIVAVLCAAAACSSVLLVSCKKDEETPEYAPPTCVIPVNVPDYTGTIEWLDGKGGTAEFRTNYPVVILFSGLSDYDVKDDYSVPSDIYFYGEGGALSKNAQKMNTNLAYYWVNQGYNVGVFHCECFCDDTEKNVLSKIYDYSAMTYTDKNGEKQYPQEIKYTLTELFVSAWYKIMSETPLAGSGRYGGAQEVKFIGNGVGVNLANAAARYLFGLYENGNISGNALPSRITMTNPYFSSETVNVDVDYAENETVTNALARETENVIVLSEKGVVYELIESNSVDYSAYAATFKDYCASLFLNETYENYYDADYAAKDRASLDWYLYSVNGSDDTSLVRDSLTNLGYKSTYPILDKRTGVDGDVPSMNACRYGVSAWTPTAYVRALRGVSFTMKGVSDVYVLNNFEAENYQYSDYSGGYICGYVYNDADASGKINFGYQNRRKGTTVTAVIEVDDVKKHNVTLTAQTGVDGFYKIPVDGDYFSLTIVVEVPLPSSNYAYYGSALSAGTYTALCRGNVALTTTDDGLFGIESITFTAAEVIGQIITVNCGFDVL